ncbi:hypothetical protein C8Q78DRAFT_1084087 [Trametes maxima]|nr:hypothetical protein C8Q78DRAFT_1084087 [Trametes maxima]
MSTASTPSVSRPHPHVDTHTDDISLHLITDHAQVPSEIQQEILKQMYGSHLAGLDDIERDEEHQTNLHQLIVSPERLQQFFKDVCTFEMQFCRCCLSDATSDRPHYNFCQVLGMEAVELEEIDNNETLARIARTATPYMTHFRMLSSRSNSSPGVSTCCSVVGGGEWSAPLSHSSTLQ